jgi:hypothetical protein
MVHFGALEIEKQGLASRLGALRRAFSAADAGDPRRPVMEAQIEALRDALADIGRQMAERVRRGAR